MIAVLVVAIVIVATIVALRARSVGLARDAAARRVVQSELRRKELGNRAIDHAMFTRQTLDAALDEIKRVAREHRDGR